MNTVLVVLGLLLTGGVLTVGYNFWSARRAEQRDLRERGSEAVTPVLELLQGLGPAAIVFGSNEQINEHLRETHRRWWEERRPALLVYGNQHPSDRVRALANELATAVQAAQASTRYLFETRLTAVTMDAHDAAEQRHQEALAKAEELMTEVRSQHVRLRLSRRGGTRTVSADN